MTKAVLVISLFKSIKLSFVESIPNSGKLRDLKPTLQT